MAKTLCDWKRDDIIRQSEKLARIVSEPRYFCSKCARVAHEKKHLCKAKAFAKSDLFAASLNLP